MACLISFCVEVIGPITDEHLQILPTEVVIELFVEVEVLQRILGVVPSDSVCKINKVAPVLRDINFLILVGTGNVVVNDGFEAIKVPTLPEN